MYCTNSINRILCNERKMTHSRVNLKSRTLGVGGGGVGGGLRDDKNPQFI